MVSKKNVASLAATWMISMAVSCAGVEIEDFGKEENFPSFPKPTEQIDKVPLTKTEQAFVEAGNKFAWNLTAKLWDKNEKKGGLFVSPLSIQYALGMVANGGVGNAPDEIAKLLGYKGTSAVNSFCKKLIQDLPRVDTTVTLALANAVLVNDLYKLNDKFTDTMKDFYDAEVANMSFQNPQAVVDHINKWCDEHTFGRIPSIIDHVSPNDVLYLMNALYFNGNWTFPFEESKTRAENFKTLAGKTVKVGMMHRTLRGLTYCENNLAQMVSLPYGNGKYHMNVFLPKKGVQMKDLIASAPVCKYSGLYDVILSLPKFKSDYKEDLAETLFDMGLPVGAYNNMLASEPSSPLVIGAVLHRANVTVSERGTEAAAATVIGMTCGAAPNMDTPPTVEFKADHSFLYTITEATSGVVLFVGVYDGD